MEAVISIRGLKHAFGDGAGRREVLHGISTDFQPGEIVIITGPSGSGKTTLLTLVGALRTIQDGEVVFEGREMGRLRTEDRAGVRRRIGYIFQAHNLIGSLTAVRNVQMAFIGEDQIPAAEARRRALEALRDVGLEEYADALPRRLSGGQKQRVAIARALVRKPRIILADEPTAALDGKTGREVVAILQRMARQTGCTILLVTHDNRILDIADRIIRIEDGTMEETHLGLERLLGGFEALIRTLPRMLAPFTAAGGMETGSPAVSRDPAFAGMAAAMRADIAALSNGRLPAHLRERLDAIQELTGTAVSLEDTISVLLGLFSEPAARRGAGLVDPLAQSAEFLLLTAVDASASRTEEDARLLQALSGDRGGTMKELRDRHFAGQTDLDEQERAFLFDLTNTFARFVYFINRMARYLEKAAAKTSP